MKRDPKSSKSELVLIKRDLKFSEMDPKSHKYTWSYPIFSYSKSSEVIRSGLENNQHILEVIRRHISDPKWTQLNIPEVIQIVMEMKIHPHFCRRDSSLEVTGKMIWYLSKCSGRSPKDMQSYRKIPEDVPGFPTETIVDPKWSKVEVNTKLPTNTRSYSKYESTKMNLKIS